jgi:predicted NAD/FAD-dependent oxidoreductase
VTRVAVIGAGLAGLVLGHELKDDASITIFDKSRGTGGRMATRYAGERDFDHGTQFFTTRSAGFRAFAEKLAAAGVVARWDARFAELDRSRVQAIRGWQKDDPHYVGVPRMNSVGRHLAASLDVRTNTAVTAIIADEDRWRLIDRDGDSLGDFDWVVSTAPAAQTAALLPASFSGIDRVSTTQMLACFALMIGLETPLDLPWQAALVHDADLSWVSVNSSKPGRPPGYALLAHARNSWANEHIDRPLDDVRRHLVSELEAIIGESLAGVVHVDVHRWRYANIDRQSGELSLLDAQRKLAACGDWCIRGRVEAAYRSATDLASRVRDLL